MPLKPDTTIKGYSVVKSLGSGGMAEVYLATQQSLERPVALKEMRAKFEDSPAIVEQFEQEARILASIQHPNITHIYDYWQRRRNRYIVMEYVKGVSVDDLVERSGPLPWHIAAEITRQTALALAYAHERGLAHLDVKPANLMITYEGKVKLMDFGISRLAGGKESALGDMVIGSPGFMAPEQIRGEPSLASDQYALGVTLYGLLCDELPFAGTTLGEIEENMKRGKYTPPRKLNPGTPRKVQRVCRHMIRRHAFWRYRNIERVADALENVLLRYRKAEGEEGLMEFLDREGWIPKEASATGLLDSDTTIVQKRIRRRRTLRRRRALIRLAMSVGILAAVFTGAEAGLRWNYERVFPRRPVSLSLKVEPPVWVLVDHVPYAARPLRPGEPIELPSGEHELTLFNPLYRTHKQSIQVSAGETQALSAQMVNRLQRSYEKVRAKAIEYWLKVAGPASPSP